MTTVEKVKPDMARPELVAQAAAAMQTPETVALVTKVKDEIKKAENANATIDAAGPATTPAEANMT